MKRILVAALFFVSPFVSTSRGQASRIEPVHVSAGTVLTFYLHARLNPTSGDSVDGLPKGTLLRVKMLDSIDSTVNADGTEFHGTVMSGLTSSGELVIHPGSEVRGILALLRSRSHPEGFRYELLITDLTDHGKSYTLTASLNRSLADSPIVSTSKPAAKASSKSSESGAPH
jgi:hypothetical protein